MLEKDSTVTKLTFTGAVCLSRLLIHQVLTISRIRQTLSRQNFQHRPEHASHHHVTVNHIIDGVSLLG